VARKSKSQSPLMTGSLAAPQFRRASLTCAWLF